MARYTMLILTDSVNNNNKFYEVIEEDGSVKVRYGRVGQEGQTATKYDSFDAVVRSKTRKGYEPVKMAAQATQAKQALQSTHLTAIASRDMGVTDPAITGLLERLARVNRHQIAQATGGKIQVQEDGLIKTAVGFVTLESVQDARTLLQTLSEDVVRKRTDTSASLERLNAYLTAIPQKVPAKRGWGPTFLTDYTTLTAQWDLLDQLEQSLKNYAKERKRLEQQQAAVAQQQLPPERVFHYAIKPLHDDTVFKKTETFFKQHARRGHASSHLTLKHVYDLEHAASTAIFEAEARRLGNVQTLWHGTRASNILSILREGLIIPPQQGTYQINGRMFGHGIYFSDQSTKSLNYSYGFWDGRGRDNNCFMFLCEVAMGKAYTPTSSDRSFRTGGNFKPPKGYDSCFAQGGVSAVHNNEMIVYSTAQARLRYLCEFDIT